jgi:lincosamide nucleotidyltransferase A/C/D/E
MSTREPRRDGNAPDDLDGARRAAAWRGTADHVAASKPSRLRLRLRAGAVRVARRLKLTDSRAGRALAARMAQMRERHVIEALDALSAAGVSAWVAGGWGVDALEGRSTRAHQDLDLVIDRADERHALAALAARGYCNPEVSVVERALLPRRVLVHTAAGRAIDVHPVDLRSWLALDVAALLDLGEGDPAGAAFAEGVLGGRPVACLSRALQLRAHQGYKHRETDLHDLDVLSGDRRFVRRGPRRSAPR